MALHVYDSLMSCGKNYGLRNAGYYALRTLRTEKFFSYWGTDLLPQDTPLECGREFRVKFDVSSRSLSVWVVIICLGLAIVPWHRPSSNTGAPWPLRIFLIIMVTISVDCQHY